MQVANELAQKDFKEVEQGKKFIITVINSLILLVDQFLKDTNTPGLVLKRSKGNQSEEFPQAYLYVKAESVDKMLE